MSNPRVPTETDPPVGWKGLGTVFPEDTPQASWRPFWRKIEGWYRLDVYARAPAPYLVAEFPGECPDCERHYVWLNASALLGAKLLHIWLFKHIKDMCDKMQTERSKP